MTFAIRDPGLSFQWARTLRQSTVGIVVHHLDAHWDVHRTHAFHQSLGWNGIGYNYHIAMDGTISLGCGMEFVGAHTNPPAGTNDSTIGIGCEGRYHSIDRTMPDRQYNALVWLIRHLRDAYGDIWVQGHRELAATACPGQFFPLDEVRTLTFRKSEETQVPVIAEQRFQSVEEMPNWAKSHMEALTTTCAKDGLPILRGDGAGNLDLSLDMIRLIVLFERRLEAQLHRADTRSAPTCKQRKMLIQWGK